MTPDSNKRCKIQMFKLMGESYSIYDLMRDTPFKPNLTIFLKGYKRIWNNYQRWLDVMLYPRNHKDAIFPCDMHLACFFVELEAYYDFPD